MNPNQVPITLTLNVDQINTILDGLGELPFKRVEALASGIRTHAIQRLQEAEREAVAQAVSENVQEAIGGQAETSRSKKK